MFSTSRDIYNRYRVITEMNKDVIATAFIKNIGKI